MVLKTKMLWSGWFLYTLIQVYRSIVHKRPETAKDRIEQADSFLFRADHSKVRAFRISNVHSAYRLMDGGGEDNIEEIGVEPNRADEFREMIKLQHRILTTKRHASDLAASGYDYEGREKFFRENMYRHLDMKIRDHDLLETVVGYHRDSRTVSDFTPELIDFLIDASTEEIASKYRS